MSYSDPKITKRDDGKTQYEADFGPGLKPIPVHVHPQTTDEEFAQAATAASARVHSLFVEMLQDESIGLDAAISAMASVLGAAIGGAAQQTDLNHKGMQQMLADYLRNTMSSADATFNMLAEGGSK